MLSGFGFGLGSILSLGVVLLFCLRGCLLVGGFYDLIDFVCLCLFFGVCLIFVDC